MKWRKYTDEERKFFAEYVPGHSHKEILEEFNRRFGGLELTQLKAYIKNNKLNTGRTGRFGKGHVPANKGEKMPAAVYERCEQTMFKAGSRPHNHLEIGTEILNTKGYWQVKTAEQNAWTLKHRIIWERAHGRIPEGHIVIFADRDRNNFELDNLLLISRQQAVRMNQNGLISENREATKTGVLIADLIAKTADRARSGKRK